MPPEAAALALPLFLLLLVAKLFWGLRATSSGPRPWIEPASELRIRVARSKDEVLKNMTMMAGWRKNQRMISYKKSWLIYDRVRRQENLQGREWKLRDPVQLKFNESRELA